MVLLGGAYMYFFGGGNVQETESALSSSTGNAALNAEMINQQISTDTAFLSTLLGITSIKIDPALFTSASFSALKDSTVTIETTGEVGRTNPFAPFDDNSVLDANSNLNDNTPAIVLPVNASKTNTIDKNTKAPTKK